MIRSNLRDYVSDLCNVYILVSGSITIDGEGDDDATKLLDKRNEGVIFNPLTVYVGFFQCSLRYPKLIMSVFPVFI